MFTREPQRQIDAIIIFAPEVLQNRDDFFCHSLQAALAEHLPVHLLIMDGIPKRAERFASKIFPSCIVHRIPRKTGSIQTAALAEVFQKNGILRPMFIVMEPKLVPLAMRAYAPLKTFGLLASLTQTISKWKGHRRQADMQLLHSFLARQTGLVFHSKEASMDLLRKDLGYYGSALESPASLGHFWNTVKSAIQNRLDISPLYPHKLDILVIMETNTLEQSVWADYITTLYTFSRHRISFIQQHAWQAEQRKRKQASTCHGYDAVISAVEDRAQQDSTDAPLGADVASFVGYKIMLLGRAKQISPASAKQAVMQRAHHIVSAMEIPQTLVEQHNSMECTGSITPDDWQEFDEMLTRRVLGAPNRLLLGRNNIMAHGPALDAPHYTEDEWEDPLDEAYRIESYYLQKLPLVESKLRARIEIQREEINRLDETIRELIFKCDNDSFPIQRDRGLRGLFGRILNSLHKRYGR